MGALSVLPFFDEEERVFGVFLLLLLDDTGEAVLLLALL